MNRQKIPFGRTIWALNMHRSVFKQSTEENNKQQSFDASFFSEANKHKPEVTVFDNSKNLVIFNLNDNDCTIEDMNAVRKVESGDLVLGFTVLNKVNCVGYVESVIVSQPDKVELNINWVKNIASSALSEAVFSHDYSIQYVTEEMINKIDLDLVRIDKLVSKQQKSIGPVTEKILNQQVIRADSSDEEQNDGGGGSIRVFLWNKPDVDR